VAMRAMFAEKRDTQKVCNLEGNRKKERGGKEACKQKEGISRWKEAKGAHGLGGQATELAPEERREGGGRGYEPADREVIASWYSHTGAATDEGRGACGRA